MAPKSGGYVYILTNPKIPGLVKIGSTKLTPDERARQLSTTGVPAPFQVVGYHWFDDELRIERELQAMFSQQRVHPRREFYETTIDAAQQALLHLSDGRHHESARASSGADETTASNATLGPQSRPTSNTSASVLGLPYWTRFNEFRAERNLLPRFETAGPRFFHRHFLVHPSRQNRKRNIHYEGRIRINSPQISMRVIFKTADDIKELFDLVARDKRQIEQALGFSLQWIRDRGRYECHIAVERDGVDPRDVSEWDRQHAWLSEIVSGFEAAIRPRIAELPS
jgi:Domain of unknown function (DUF4268)/T5orf172 domain